MCSWKLPSLTRTHVLDSPSGQMLALEYGRSRLNNLLSTDPQFKTPPMSIMVAESLLPTSHMDSSVTNDGLSVPNVHHSMQLMCAGRRRYSFHTLVVSVIFRVQRSSRNAPYAPQRGRSVASGCLVPSSSPPGFAANSPSSSVARPH